MKTVRINNNIIVETIPDYCLPLEKWYPRSFCEQCIEVDDYVEENMVYNEETNKYEHPIVSTVTQFNEIDKLKSYIEYIAILMDIDLEV